MVKKKFNFETNGGGDIAQQQQQPNCRKLGEYDPCQNPCARIPGQHPFCPPGQVIGILPKSYVLNPFPREGPKPCVPPPPRHPWKQCIENNLINDQVRRPLARWSHIRELPPVVIPCSEIERIKEKITERDRLKAECEARVAERECQRQASYQRHSEWNYTVDSLLARKRAEEEAKERQLENEFFHINKCIKDNRDANSAEVMARAKQQLLYKKGLIRDFHAALAYSKSIKEAEALGNKSNSREICKFPADAKCEDACQQRMMFENDRPDYSEKKEVQKKECTPELLQLLQCDESRVPQRQAELEQEKTKLKELRNVDPLPWPENYIKYIAEPKCDDNNEECKKKLCERKTAIFNEIHDHLANDEFIRYQEEEIDRQACEYNQYKRKVDRLRKQKEKQLIEEKVAKNIENAEKAGKKLMEMKAMKKTNTNEYARLKEQWETEFAQHGKEHKKWREVLIERAAQDFVQRKDVACCKRAELDAGREWEKDCCNAIQTYERQCELENKRRAQAEELQKYHREQIMEKTEREEAERGENAAWGEKARMNYACDMKEMKEYAFEQIKEWKAKGRPTFPMTHAMKKWDYEYGMSPFLYTQTQTTDGSCPPYQSTAQRLGFCNGGT